MVTLVRGETSSETQSEDKYRLQVEKMAKPVWLVTIFGKWQMWVFLAILYFVYAITLHTVLK